MSQEWEPWNPIRNPVTIKIIGKLLEELGELISALARSLIQGIEENHPETGKPNRQWILEEEADVLLGLRFLREHMKITDAEYDISCQRRHVKKDRLEKWHTEAGGPPVAYAYELACRIEHTAKGLVYSDFQPRLTFYPPNVPEGSIRNLRELRL